MEKYRIQFARNLRRLMFDTNTTQVILAEACGLAQSDVSKYANGKSSPLLERAARIADFFNISLDQMLGREVHHGEV